MTTFITLSQLTPITIQKVMLCAHQKAKVKLSQDEGFKEFIQAGSDYLMNSLHETGVIYGVTTGYGDDCTRPVPLEYVHDLPKQLLTFHGCGLGEYLTLTQSRAVLLVRLATLCQGFSGVSFNLLKQLELLLEHDIIPVIPSLGSVGASGDLTPLSYVAAVVMGLRKVYYQGEICNTKDVFEKLGIEPYQLLPKEALAIMNGTAVMTALACEVYERSAYVIDLSSRLTALTNLALKGNPIHFDEYLFKAKPHPGQGRIAKKIAADLMNTPSHFPQGRLQDRYSTRCAPHVIGVLEDFMDKFKEVIETEINSACDNPLIDIREKGKERILSGGHFYGGHIAFVMDSMKLLVANIADLIDRQLATLVDPKMNHGLPANLTGQSNSEIVLNHGLKAVQILASALTAEALKGTLSASIFSRSTESHNQDKVSMGTISARDALNVLHLTEQVMACHVVATSQALSLREQMQELSAENYTADVKKYLDQVREIIPFISHDIELDSYLRKTHQSILDKAFWLYGK